MLAGDRARQRDALELAVNRPVNFGLDRPQFGHLDPVVAGLDADAVIAGLLAPLALEARIAGLLLGVEEALEGMIKVDARLLERHGIRPFQPAVLARFLGHRQQLLDVVLGAQRLPVTLVAMRHDAKAGVVAETYRTELAVQELRLLGRGIDAYLGGLQHVSAHCYNSQRLRTITRNVK